MPKVASHTAYQNSIIRKKFTVPFLKYKRLKLKLRVFLAGHSVAMVTYNVTKTTPTCSPMIGRFLITMVASTDKRVVIMTHQNLRLGKCWKLFWATLKMSIFHLKETFASVKSTTTDALSILTMFDIKFLENAWEFNRGVT